MFRILLLIFSILTATSCKLIFSTVLFRHGARAPSAAFSNESFAFLFPSGLGELTDDGIRHSFHMGRLLRTRYVDSGFLSNKLRPSEFYFRSLAINRCLMTASSVGAGMFATEKESSVPVPVYSQITGENLLDYDNKNCVVERRRLLRYCSKVPALDSFPSWPAYEAFVFECIGLNNGSTLFPNRTSFEIVEALINEDRNNLPMSAWFNQNREAIYETYNKVFRFILGIGEFHSPHILRLKAGQLLHTILADIRLKWECHQNATDCNKTMMKRKFMAYSTQDWILAVILESLGPHDLAIGQKFPEYNSMIILELVETKPGDPGVQVFYRRGAGDDYLLDVTSGIRGCSTSPCPLKHFLSCCDEFTSTNFQDECDGNLTMRKVLKLRTSR